jgi:peptidoglycan/LPS O-acetylase OafA/YrhL
MSKITETNTTATSATPERMPSSRLPGLDGLRAIAVAAVVVFHLVPGLLPGGGLGVDIFFVISGFLITGLLFSESDSTGRIRLSSFWSRRARRLVPALAIVVTVCCSAALLIGGDVLVGLGKQVLGAATFSYNWLAIASGSSYFSGATPELFRNLWSLAVEEQFYLIWPFVILLVVLLRRSWQRLAIFLVVAAASAVEMALLYVPGTDPTREYYGTDTHCFGLALGAALAVATHSMSRRPLEWPKWSRRLLPIPGAIALLGVIYLAVIMPSDAPVAFHGGLALVAVLTAVAIWGAIVPGSFLGAALDVAPLRWVGERSYGIYLWHWPVIVLLVAAFPKWQDSPTSGLLMGFIAVAITVGAAALSYQFVERPIRRGGVRRWLGSGFRAGSMRTLRIGAASFAILLVAVVVGGTSLAIKDAPASGRAQKDISAGKVAIASARYLPPPPPGSAGSNIVAIGDSVMLASAPALIRTFPGIDINAAVSRQMKALPGIVGVMLQRHQLRQILIVGLGTNGYINQSTLDQVRTMIGPTRQMIVVNVEEPRVWEASVNQKLASFANNYDNVELADWYHAIKPHISILAPDHIHPGPTGARIYAGAIQAALDRLAALPPYPKVAEFFATTATSPTK